MSGEKSWIVVVDKDGKTNAAINNHINTEDKLLALGYEIIGYPYFKRKRDAIIWCSDYTPKKARKKI